MPATLYGVNLMSAYAVSGDLYLALCVTSPTFGSTGSDISEPPFTEYYRQYLDFAEWSAPSAGVCSYTQTLTYLPTINWGVVTSYAICTESVLGEVIAYGPLNRTVDIQAGSALHVSPGMITYGVQ